MRSMWSPVIRVVPERGEKKGRRGPSAPPEGRARPGNLGEGETTDFRDDPAGRRGGGADAGERPANHYPAPHRAVHRSGEPGVYRRV